MSTESGPEPRWLDDREAAAWRGYLRMRALLDLQISRDLAGDGLSDADYQVLVGLSEAPAGRVRLTELARLMLWSKSRLAHQIDRMACRGLVGRETDPALARAAIVALTAAGRRTISEAAPRHVASVRRHFLDLLTPEQIDVIAVASGTVVGHLRAVRDAEQP